MPPQPSRIMRYEWRLSLKRNVPSPPRRTRGGEASTKPSSFVAVDLVEAARSWGGQSCVLFILERQKRSLSQSQWDTLVLATSRTGQSCRSLDILHDTAIMTSLRATILRRAPSRRRAKAKARGRAEPLPQSRIPTTVDPG